MSALSAEFGQTMSLQTFRALNPDILADASSNKEFISIRGRLPLQRRHGSNKEETVQLSR